MCHKDPLVKDNNIKKNILIKKNFIDRNLKASLVFCKKFIGSIFHILKDLHWTIDIGSDYEKANCKGKV
jgi:hypothetical protein